MSSVSVTAATMVLRRKFSAKHYFEDVRRYNVTVMQYIGELCRYLLTVPEVKKYGRFQDKVQGIFCPSLGAKFLHNPLLKIATLISFSQLRKVKKNIFFLLFLESTTTYEKQ